MAVAKDAAAAAGASTSIAAAARTSTNLVAFWFAVAANYQRTKRFSPDTQHKQHTGTTRHLWGRNLSRKQEK